MRNRPDDPDGGWDRYYRPAPSDSTSVMPGGRGHPGDGRMGAGHPGYGEPGWGGPPGPVRRPVRKRRWGRRLFVALVILLVLLLALYLFFDLRLSRVEALPDYDGRPDGTSGQTWLVVGSDSREGLSRDERREYATGRAEGRRTDTMMLLHMPGGGEEPTLVSLPRDSYVPIPGHGRNKLNAAYSAGGPELLSRTVEDVSGLRIDHYMEVGFGGFVGMVDAVGGVEICTKRPMRDPKAGLDLDKGCNELDGGEALGFVRTRATARGDLDRVQNQRKFLGALIGKATSPGTALNPFRSIPFALRASDATEVDNADRLYHLMYLAWGMRGIGDGDVVTTSVPVGGAISTPNAGSAIRWDRAKAIRLFEALKENEPVPKDVVSD